MNNEFLQNNSIEGQKKEDVSNDVEDVDKSEEEKEEKSPVESNEDAERLAKEKINSLIEEAEKSLGISESEENTIVNLGGNEEEAKNLTSDIDSEIENILKEAVEEIYKWMKLDNPNFDENNFYRIINEEGYKDFVDNKIVRSRQETQEMKNMSVLERVNLRHPTPFPSFAKGTPDLEYAKPGEDNYILESNVPMYKKGDINPVKGSIIGGKHGAYRPYDENGLWREEMSPEEIKNVYKIDKDRNLYIRQIDDTKNEVVAENILKEASTEEAENVKNEDALNVNNENDNNLSE